MTDFLFFANPALLPALMLVLLAACIEVPYRLRGFLSQTRVNMDAWNAVQAGILTLAAFVLGLSFSQASARFDARRGLVVKEANAIATTWLRADQLQPLQTRNFRAILVGYTAARLRAYETPGDRPLYGRTIAQSARQQAQLWSLASSGLRAHPANLGLSLLLESLNDTIDVSADQVQALKGHVPTAMVLFTLALVVLGALSTGVRFAHDKSRPLLLSAIYVVASVVVISMVVDYDRPQTGLVTVDFGPLSRQLQSMQGAR
jgi:hypothetical protein